MLGAIIGSLAADSSAKRLSRGIHSPDFWISGARLTADGILTLAVAAAVMDYRQYVSSQQDMTGRQHTAFNRPVLKSCIVNRLQEVGRRHMDAGYSADFNEWLKQDDPRPAGRSDAEPAGRISSIGFSGGSEAEVKRFSAAVTEVTHRSAAAEKGAEAVALTVYWAKQGYTREAIRERIHRHYFKLNFSMRSAAEHGFETEIPSAEAQAIKCFLESDGFEDAIRLASAADRNGAGLAVMTGGIAHAHYGVPAVIRAKTLQHLEADLRQICDRFAGLYGL